MATVILSNFERVIKVSSAIESYIMEELSRLHRLTQKNALTKVSPAMILLEIDICQKLWLKNNHLLEILVKPIDEISGEIKARFNTRSDLILGVGRYLKDSLKKFE